MSCGPLGPGRGEWGDGWLTGRVVSVRVSDSTVGRNDGIDASVVMSGGDDEGVMQWWWQR